MTKLTFIAYDIIFTQTAQNLNWKLQKVQGAAKTIISQGKTKKNGQPNNNMLAENESLSGTYELHLDFADYFQNQGWELPDTPLLEQVSFRFSIEDDGSEYEIHVQMTPHSYNFAINKK